MKNFYEHYGKMISRIPHLNLKTFGKEITNKFASDHFKSYFHSLLRVSYLKKFLDFGKAMMDKSDPSWGLAQYAIMLNKKANELLMKAAFNKNINLKKLQKEILEAGKQFVHEFSVKRKNNQGPFRGKGH